MRGTILATATILLTAACGAGSAGVIDPPRSTTPPSTVQLGSIRLHSTMHPAPGGVYYTEGAMAEVRLYRDGLLVKTRTAVPGHSISFEGLPYGHYVLAPALRPCDGNCGYLDPRTAGCHTDVQLSGDAMLTVSYTVEEPCRFVG